MSKIAEPITHAFPRVDGPLTMGMLIKIARGE
jgi:hypothetical protein